MQTKQQDNVLTAPDGSTKYLADLDFDVDFAHWCLEGGRPVLHGFAHFLDQPQPIEAIAA